VVCFQAPLFAMPQPPMGAFSPPPQQHPGGPGVPFMSVPHGSTFPAQPPQQVVSCLQLSAHSCILSGVDNNLKSSKIKIKELYGIVS